MTMPVAQLAANFARPATLEGLSVISAIMAMAGRAVQPSPLVPLPSSTSLFAHRVPVFPYTLASSSSPVLQSFPFQLHLKCLLHEPLTIHHSVL